MRLVTTSARLARSAAPLVPLVACTAFEPGTDELASDLAVQQSLEPGQNWACLPAEGPTPRSYLEDAASTQRLVRSIQVLSLVSSSPVPGITVKACAQRDIECAEPVTETLPVGDDGWVDVPLYDGFLGYFEIQGESVIPTALFFPDPVHEAGLYTEPFGLVERAALPNLTRAIGASQSEDLGLVAIRALDCAEQDASGVRYAIDKQGVVPWYFVGGLPSGTTTETVDSSLGGFLNVAPGAALVTASLEPSMRAIVAPTSVLVRPGWMTVVRIVPSEL